MSKRHQMQASTDGQRTAVGIMVQENLLPAPEELLKFKEIDSSIISWMMQYADKEQDTRIKAQEAMINFDLERIELAKTEHNITKTSLWLAFFVVILFITLSAFLIYSGLKIAGSIFGVAALILCVQAFLKFGRNQNQ